MSRYLPRRLYFGVGALSLALSAPAAAATLGHGHPATPPVRDSAFGMLVYESSGVCAGSSAAEVAFVGDRVVAATETPGRVLRAIDRWVAKQSAKRTDPRTISALPSGDGVAASLPSAAGAPGATTIAGSIEFPKPRPGADSITAVTAYDLPGSGPYDILALVRSLRSAGVEASPDYVVRPLHHDFYMPDGLPEPTEARLQPRAPFGSVAELGENVRMTVFDTGLTAPGRLPSATTILPADVENPDADGDGIADNGAVGHGQAISSLIWSLVPGAEVTNARVTLEGISTDWSSAQRIVQVLDRTAVGDRPHLVLASFGTEACDIDPEVPGDELLPLSLRGATEWVDQLSDAQPAEMALIGAAGNHGTARRQYPSAFPTAIAVGALDLTLDADGDPLTSPDGTGHVAEFSGRGEWVDIYAPGVAITTQHVGRPGAAIDFGPLAHGDDSTTPVRIDGRAVVQGTSYSVPAFAAAVAETMAEHGDTVSGAVARITAAGVAPLPPCVSGSAVVTGVAVAWISSGGPITDQPTDRLEPRC